MKEFCKKSSGVTLALVTKQPTEILNKKYTILRA